MFLFPALGQCTSCEHKASTLHQEEVVPARTKNTLLFAQRTQRTVAPRRLWGGMGGGGVQYLSGTSGLCQHGAISQFFGGFSSFGPMHENFVP